MKYEKTVHELTRVQCEQTRDRLYRHFKEVLVKRLRDLISECFVQTLDHRQLLTYCKQVSFLL